MEDLIRFVIGTIILGLLFGVMEWLWPEDRQQARWRKDSKTDLIYWFFDNYVGRLVANIGVVIAIGLTARFIPSQNLGVVALQPGWLQAIELLLLGDLIGYWVHRSFHRQKSLWKFHAVHHSIEKIDWLAAARVHPFETVASRVAVTLPLYFLGFSGGVLTFYAPFLAIYPIFLHANLSWNYGPLRYLIASPAFHRWHHSSDVVALDKNFSGLFPFIDVLFGTAYFPRASHPQSYGLYKEKMPAGLLKQLIYPFKRRSLQG